MSPATDALSVTFAALSDPTRRAMLARLVQGEASVNELAEPFKMSLPAVSKHIKVLEKAGLLIKTRQAQQRPCKINGEQLRQTVEWLEQYRQLWEGRLDRLDACLLELHAAESAKRSEAEMTSQADISKSADMQVKPQRADRPARPTSGPDKSKHTQRSAGNTPPTKEKQDDDGLQQQIGFDF